VQQSLLPQELLKVPGARFAWVFEACDDLAGDTLNVFALDRDHVGLYVLDVSGHGVVAALLAVQLSRLLCPREESSIFVQPVQGTRQKRLVPPAEVAGSLSRRFPFDANAEQYFTLAYGILNLRSGEFRYVCAGHPGPAYVPCAGPPRVLSAAGVPIGVGDGNYHEHRLQLKPGDRLYMYSDGLTDGMNADRALFGTDRLLTALSRPAALQDSLNGLLDDLRAWQVRARDDISILGMEWTGTPPDNTRPFSRLREVAATT
jgi:phosphoserine phosphatase RsbU/P